MGTAGVKGAMLGSDIMLKCNGSGKSSEGSNHGGEGYSMGKGAMLGNGIMLKSTGEEQNVGGECCMGTLGAAV